MADKLLFTPGPLTTSATVKEAMLRDLGSRDTAFIELVRDVRRRLVALAGLPAADFTCVIMQGSGTFTVESVLTSCVPRAGKLLVLANGAYGARMGQIAKVAGVPVEVVSSSEERPVDAAGLDALLERDPAVTQVAVVHCETTTGLLNPVLEIGRVVKKHGRQLIVNAMSSFGAVPVDLSDIDYLVSSANKCVEGVPGFAFAIARLSSLRATEGWARSLSLDLFAQWKGLEQNGQFRFTPPTHALLAFRQALDELDAEGGAAGRAARYRRNRDVLLPGMHALGFEELLPAELVGHIITSFRYLPHPKFDFTTLYQKLSDRGYVIYPGKVSRADCFRVGHIGRISAEQTQGLVAAFGEVLTEMGVRS